MPSFSLIKGKSKLIVSLMMSCNTSSGILSPTKGFITSKPISSFEKDLMLAIKSFDNEGMLSGKYNPLSGAWPLTVASSNVVVGEILFKIVIVHAE